MRLIFVVLAMIMITCVSCDPPGEYIYMIKNNSDFDFTVEYSLWHDIDSSVVVTKNSSVVFYSEVMCGGNPYDEGEDFLYLFKEITLITPDSIYVTKDFLERDNWDYRLYGEKPFDFGTGEYVFTINNSDIENID